MPFFHRAIALYNPTISVTYPFFAFDLLVSAPSSPFSLSFTLYVFPHGPAQLGHVHSVLSQVSLSHPFSMSSHLSVINSLLHCSKEQPCSFFSISFFFIKPLSRNLELLFMLPFRVLEGPVVGKDFPSYRTRLCSEGLIFPNIPLWEFLSLFYAL